MSGINPDLAMTILTDAAEAMENDVSYRQWFLTAPAVARLLRVEAAAIFVQWQENLNYVVPEWDEALLVAQVYLANREA